MLDSNESERHLIEKKKSSNLIRVNLCKVHLELWMTKYLKNSLAQKAERL